MKFAKHLVFAGVVFGSMAVVGVSRLVTAPKQAQGNPQDPTQDMAAQVSQAVLQAKAAGTQEGIEQAIAPPTLDAALAGRQAALDKAKELAVADAQNLICARADQYLSAAKQQQVSASLDIERWLLAQLAKENDQVKALMATHGSLDGTAANAQALDSPLRNRAAILAALSTLYTGDSTGTGCRVVAFDSSTQVDGFLFNARRIKESQTSTVTNTEVAREPQEDTP